MTENEITQEELEELIINLDINLDNIYHLVFLNGTEMIGELFDEANDDEPPPEDGEFDIELVDDAGDEISFDEPLDDRLFLNPIRIHKEPVTDSKKRVKQITHFMEWNPSIDGPFTHVYKKDLSSQKTPDAENLIQYLRFLYKLYYPVLDEVPAGNLSKIGTKIGLEAIKNIVDFRTYQLKRLKGIF